MQMILLQLIDYRRQKPPGMFPNCTTNGRWKRETVPMDVGGGAGYEV